MDFKDWVGAIAGGKVLFRISPTKRYSDYCKTGGYFVEKWRWWWPFSWKTVWGEGYVRYSRDTVQDYKSCEDFINRKTTMYEREK